MPLQKRGAAVGLNVSAMFLGFVIVGPLSGGISQVAGWRSVLLLFIFPLSMVCLILSLLVIPNKTKTNAEQISKPKYLEAYKQIFLNKSATFCLIGTTFLAIFNTIPVYAVSFYRIFFFTSPLTGGIFSAVAAAGGLFGGAAAGRLVNQYGRKLLTVTGAFIAGIFAILFTFMPIMWISVVFWAVSASLAAFTMAALFSLVLEQVPEFRASMMSTNSTFRAAGAILGIAIGGIVLNLYENNFQLLMTVFGASGIALAAVIFLFAKDPSKTQTASSPRNVKQ
jgi:predicted MFS family arabinose efflux permease